MKEIKLNLKKSNPEKLLKYGFLRQKNILKYTTEILGGDFTLNIECENNCLKTELVENTTKEEYTLHLLPGAEGDFIGKVRKEYEKVINDITEKCFEADVFKYPQTKRIMGYMTSKYGDLPEYLWEKFPDNAVFRRNDNQKWYAAILTVKRFKIVGESEEPVEVIDLRASKEELPELIKSENIYVGYHMNKKHWFTIILDGSVDFDTIAGMIDESYILAAKK